MCVLQKEEHYRGKSEAQWTRTERKRGKKHGEWESDRERERENVGFSSPKGN